MGKMGDMFLIAGVNARRSNADGLTTIFCRLCGRPIMKVAKPVIRTVSKCQVCILTEQGVVDAEKIAGQQYIQLDPMSPPVPFDADNPIFTLYPESETEQGKLPPSGGVVGTVMSFFRAIGWGRVDKPVPTPSKKIARTNRSGGLYEK